MSDIVLVTTSSGLIGSETVKFWLFRVFRGIEVL